MTDNELHDELKHTGFKLSSLVRQFKIQGVTPIQLEFVVDYMRNNLLEIKNDV